MNYIDFCGVGRIIKGLVSKIYFKDCDILFYAQKISDSDKGINHDV